MASSATAQVRGDERLRRAFDEQLALAAAAGKTRRNRGELAASAGYDARTKRLRIELLSGVGISIPVARVEGLADTPASVIRTVRVDGGGYGLHWPSLDLDLAVPDLIAGVFGSRAWMRALARQGGKATTAAKRRASQENGKKGGRPRKTPSGATTRAS
jgi:hypothetical protein